MRNSDANLKDYFNLPNPGLVTYFARVRSGNSEEYRTTFGRGSTVQEILDQWSKVLKRIGSEWPTLLDYENDLRSKVGPLSIQKPLSERMDDIKAYYELIDKPSEALDARAIKLSLDEWKRCPRLTLRGQKRTVELMKKSTSSGNPYFTKRRAVVDKTLPTKAWLDAPLVHSVLNGKGWLSCAILGWRGQEGGADYDDVKQRVIWMFPFNINILELQFYQPAIEIAQRYNIVPAWISMDAVDERITKLFDTKSPKDLIVCTDFSKFDQHFNSSLQDGARYIIGELMSKTKDSELWLKHVFPIKYNIPMMYDMGKLITGPHGMASGSGGTNFDETIIHRVLQYEAALSAESTLNPNSMCLGDDGILSYPGIQVEDVMRAYTKHGLDMNADKQYASTQDCTYLRRWHHVKYRRNGICVGVYSTYRALGRLCEQERFYDPEKWGAKMVALRQLSIIENCKYHPLFEEFIEFCMKRDKFRLGLDIPGFLEHIGKEAEKAIEYMPDFLGYTKSIQQDATTGIENWAVVKYLKSKR